MALIWNHWWKEISFINASSNMFFLTYGVHVLGTFTWCVFNNASARSAIECFLPERKRSPRCLQALAILVDRCIARKSKMATKTITSLREGRCMQYFRFGFRNEYVCFFVRVYETEQFKLKVGRCFALISNQWRDLICLLQGAAFFIERAHAIVQHLMITLTSARWSARIVELASGVNIMFNYS